MDVYRLDGTNGWVSEVTVPGTSDALVGIEAMWDDHVMVAVAGSRTLYEVDPVANTSTSVATIAQVSSASDEIVLFELLGASAYMVVGSGSTYALVRYDFHFDEQTTYNTLPAEPTTLHMLRRPSPTAYMTFAGSPDDTLRVYRGNALHSTSTLSGVTVDLDQAWDGSIWALYDDDTIWRIDAKRGEEIGTAAWVSTGLPTSPAVLFSGTENATDGCSRNPYLFVAGTCGCDYLDVPITPSGLACEHYTATVGSGASLADGVTLESGSTVGAGATLGAGSLIAARASVGANATLGTDVIVGRNALIGASVVVGDDVVLGRDANIVTGTLHDNAVVGYASTVDGATLGNATMVGSLATVDGTWSLGTTGMGGGVVVARSAQLLGGGTIERGSVMGPGVTTTGGTTIGEACRLRRDVSLGLNATLGDAVRLGRDVSMGSNVEIRAGSRVGTNAAFGANQCVPANTVVRNNESVTGSTCP